MKSLLIFLFAFSSFAYSQAPDNQDIRDLVEDLRARKHNAGAAVAVFSGDTVKYLGFHGHADVESQQAVSDDTLFMIGSTTKAMTATAAGYVVQDGMLRWDSRVQSVVPNFQLMDQKATREATLRDLLLHRVGLPRHEFAWLSRTWTSEQFLGILPFLQSSAGFREKWQYQNLMYMVAGLVVGNSAKTSWSDVVTRRIFSNLAMNDSRALLSDVEASDTLAVPHAWNGSDLIKIPARDIDGVGPAGSVHSSLRDMVQWMQFNLNQGQTPQGENLNPSIMAEIHKAQIDTGQNSPFSEFREPLRYGFGWIVSNYRGHKYIEHGGGIDGFLTHVAFLPDLDLGMVVLTNGGSLHPSAVTLSVLDKYMGASEVDWIARMDAQTPTPLPFPEVEFPSSYTSAEGTYSHPGYGTIVAKEIEVSGNKFLNLKLNEMDLTVNPWKTDEPDLWLYDYQGVVFKLHFSSDGIVELIEARFQDQGIDLIRFEKEG